jgi:hypothetical protein
LKALRFASLLLVVLTFGLTWAHVMEITGKLRLSAEQWLAVQHNLYIAFGFPVGAAFEVASIAACWWLVRNRRTAFRWTLAAGLCTTLGLAIWFWLVAPMNAIIAASHKPPPTWSAIRDQWEIGQAIHCLFFGLGFTFLTMALFAETPP